jgi:hypothetical protein
MDLYTKEKDGKYRKIGGLESARLYDGLWLIQSQKGSTGGSNLFCYMGDLPRPTDVNKFVKAYVNKDNIARIIMELVEEEQIMINMKSIWDIAHEIVVRLTNYRKENNGKSYY